MSSLLSNPKLLVLGTSTILYVGFKAVPTKYRNSALSSRLTPLLYLFGVLSFFVLARSMTGGRAQYTVLLIFLTVLAWAGSLLRWRRWNDWARRKYGRTKIVFDDPYGGSSAADGPPPLAPAGWFADSSSRHQLRYWDGSRWTEHVSDNGVSNVDPVA